MAVSNDALFYGAIVIVVMMIVLGSITKQRVLTYESVPFLIFVIGMIMFQIWYAMVKP